MHRYRLGEQPRDDLSATTTPEERLAMLWPLALEAWSLLGSPLPDYCRGDAPVTRRPLKALPRLPTTR